MGHSSEISCDYSQDPVWNKQIFAEEGDPTISNVRLSACGSGSSSLESIKTPEGTRHPHSNLAVLLLSRESACFSLPPSLFCMDLQQSQGGAFLWLARSFFPAYYYCRSLFIQESLSSGSTHRVAPRQENIAFLHLDLLLLSE